MALSLLSPILTWQKVAHALSSLDATPASVDAFRVLKDYLVGNGNPDLQILPFGTADIVTANGYSPIGAVTSTVYGFFAKNPGAGDGTDSFISLHNTTDNTSANLVTVVISDDNDEFTLISPQGIVFGTDLTISAATAAGGATESTATNAADGFVLVGA